MSSIYDPQALDKFLATMRGLIPNIRAGIESYLIDPECRENFEDAYQNLNSIVDIAFMLELSILHYIVKSIIGMMEQATAITIHLDSLQGQSLLTSIDLIEPCLNSVQETGNVDEDIIMSFVHLHHQFLEISEADDEQAIRNVVSLQSVSLEPIASDSSDTMKINDHEKIVIDPNFDLDFSAELIEGFLIEAEDYLDTIGTLLPDIDEHTQANPQLQQIRRSVHTLKGAAGVVGLQEVSQLAHRMEDVLDRLYDGRLSLTTEIKEVMISTYDVFEDFIRDKKANGDIATLATNLYTLYAQVLNAGDVQTYPNTNSLESEDFLHNASDSIHNHSLEDSYPLASGSYVHEASQDSIQHTELVRVPIDRIDELVRMVGELVISRSVFEQHLASLLHQVDELHLSIDRLQKTSTTIANQYEVSALMGGRHASSLNDPVRGLHRAGSDWSGIVDFDELEFDRYSDFHLMSRDLTETSADIGALGTEFRDILSEFDSYLTRQSRLTSEIQDKLMHFRMIPLGSLATRLHRAVRVTAKQRNKDVILELEGENVQFDKMMLDELNEVLLHLLRNAVDHGIESPEDRLKNGKARQGVIHIQAYREGTQIVLQIKDDGAGLNIERIKSKAVENGLVSEIEIMSWPHDQIYSLIFAPGFSTAKEVSEVSGRGVGMDIVKEIVTKLKGRIGIDSVQTQGTTLTIWLPITLALTQVLMVKANNQTLAIPLADVVQVLYIEQNDMEFVSGTQVVSINGRVMPIRSLSELLYSIQEQRTDHDRLPIIVIQIGIKQIAIVVDQLLGGREVVVKGLGTHLNHVHGLIGTTIMGDGSLVLILNPSEIEQERQTLTYKKDSTHVSQVRQAPQMYDILIVDDSFSVRRVVASLIKKAGWKPILAKNGLEALEIIQMSPRIPDLVLLDVEMPQMDGYELTSTLRANLEYQRLPIVMLTSRAGEKHRRRAFEVGATDYVVKPYQDASLIKLVNKLISRSREQM
jgi:chemosensory pili system protein ChpA (sensor histidine kinase/response regulator)